MINYTNIIREHNLKVTPQRLAIVNELHLKGHISVEALYKSMVKKFDSISLATIYKNINLMLENILVQEVKIPNQKSVYELTKEAHSHLMCTKCLNIQDITIDLKTINDSIFDTSEFKVTSTNFIFSGICKKCR